MPRIIISGAPGVGKTTLLCELARLGFATVPESARAVIAERVARGDTPRPDPLSFAGEIYRRDKLKYKAHPNEQQPVFFDRFAVESLGMVLELTSLPDAKLHAELSAFTFHRTVFLLPPWEEIYQTDSERDHSFAHAERVHRSLVDWYHRCGYTIHEVPRIGVPQRAQHLLRALGDACPG